MSLRTTSWSGSSWWAYMRRALKDHLQYRRRVYPLLWQAVTYLHVQRMELERLQPSVFQRLRRLTRLRMRYKVLVLVHKLRGFIWWIIIAVSSAFTSFDKWLRSSLVPSLRKHWLCPYSFVVYSPFASANKGACTANITGMQGVGKAFEYSDHGHHWWHQPARWHNAVIPTSSPACGNSWSCSWPSQQGGLQSPWVLHAGDGWGQSYSISSSSGSKFSVSIHGGEACVVFADHWSVGAWIANGHWT